jgi:hypothetical protein
MIGVLQMTTRSIAIAAVAVGVLTAGMAGAAGPFEGVWTGRAVTDYGRCPYPYDVELAVRDGRVRGRMVSNFERMTIDTTVDDTGRVGAVFAYSGRTLVKTTGGRLGATEGRIEWSMQEPYANEFTLGDLCHGTITLRKVSD